MKRMGILFHSNPSQVLGALVLGLIALFSSYDHITFAGRTLPLQQQWGIPFILASVATICIDAQLASRSRIRAADEAAEERDRAAEARERLIAHGEHLTHRCSGWTQEQHRQRGWAPEVA
jgi:hypothetical protein